MKKIFALALALVMALSICSASAELLKIGYVQVGHESDWRIVFLWELNL